MIAFVQSFGLILFEITSSVLELYSAVESGCIAMHLFKVLELCTELLYSFESRCIAMHLFPVLELARRLKGFV